MRDSLSWANTHRRARLLRGRLPRSTVALAGVVLAVACGPHAGGELSQEHGAEVSGAAVDGAAVDGAAQPPASFEAPVAVAEQQPVETRTCIPPEGSPTNPSTVADMVSLINALYQEYGPPVSIPCVLESLQRPLRLQATLSTFSAQPADGERNPRLFLLTDDMWVSVVAQGVGSPMLELGQLTEPGRSIKAEIEFPVTHQLTDESPYERLEFGTVTTCGLCHSNERPVFGIPNAMESDAFRPDPSLDVDIEFVRSEHADCDMRSESDRCEFLDAIFDHGSVQQHSFPDEMSTIFEQHSR